MTGEFLLGVDVGTSRVKSVLFDFNGRELFSAWRETHVKNVGNRSEIDMNDLWDDVSQTIKDVVNQAGSGSNVKAIAVSGQGEGLWLIDGSGMPVGPAILWNDNRAGELVETLKKKPDMIKTIRRITGSSLFPGATSVLLCWLRDHEPEKFEKAKKLLFCKDWIRFKLTGTVSTDVTDTSTSLLDINRREPTTELFELLGIGNKISLLPQSFMPAEHAGVVTKKAAEITGLTQGTPVAAGAFDVAATAAGCGAIKDGDACVILGTTGGTVVVSDVFRPDVNACSGTEVHVVPSQIITVSATMAATPNLNWIYNLFHKDRDFIDVEADLETIPAGCNGLIYHPYISASGERAPFYSPGARAQFSGIDGTSDPLTMTRAVYEGVAFSIKDCLKGQNPKRLFLAGGGARSPFWRNLIANCTGLPIFISKEVEMCARGSALMAGTAVGIFPDIETAINSMVAPTRIDPVADQVAIYNEIFKKYDHIKNQMIPVWNS